VDAIETRTSLSVLELLLTDETIPADVRDAIRDGRAGEAGRRLMELYDLSCEEATALIDQHICS
jgi:hypothetical protein